MLVNIQDNLNSLERMNGVEITFCIPSGKTRNIFTSKYGYTERHVQIGVMSMPLFIKTFHMTLVL